MSVKLTDAQLVMMSAAAQRKNSCLSAPATIKGAAFNKVSAKLAKAIAVDEGSQDATEHSEAPQPRTKTRASPDEGGDPARVAAPRDVSKLARVIDLLQRSDGATVPNLTEAMGWLPHMTWAALIGLRKRMDLPGGDADRQCRYLEAAEVELNMLTLHAFRPT